MGYLAHNQQTPCVSSSLFKEILTFKKNKNSSSLPFWPSHEPQVSERSESIARLLGLFLFELKEMVKYVLFTLKEK